MGRALTMVVLLAVLAPVGPAAGQWGTGNGYAAMRAAARRGDSRAAFMLALIYLDGAGVPSDPVTAARYMKMAAQGGLVRAQYYLGTFYHEGTGVREDRRAAARWIGKAASAGDAEAQYAYGLLLLSGDGVPVDKVQAIDWLGRASRHGNEGARDVLQELVSFQGRPTELRALHPTLSASSPMPRREGNDGGPRLAEKGVILDEGEFSLKFSLPGLTGAKSPYPTAADENLWNRLQGGTFEIIYRPGTK
ncbi:tetratricopeptide repeat protein [Geobacter sp.]|uniref:tetratricopeptide repeat protein n=1 Tax=Geobacter sp. TaxID=46610 RepID=UPI00260BF085|nr:tetratricopeptide repeat protein [Geobacter sp.]